MLCPQILELKWHKTSGFNFLSCPLPCSIEKGINDPFLFHHRTVARRRSHIVERDQGILRVWLPDFMPFSWKAGFGSTGTTVELGDKLEELGERLDETVENAGIVADGDAYTAFIDDPPRKRFLDKISYLYNISKSLILCSVSLIIAHHPMFHFLNVSSQHS